MTPASRSCTRWSSSSTRTAPTSVLLADADPQAYRTDRFEGWLRQPAEVGPVLFSNSSPTYANLRLVEGGSDSGGGMSTGLLIALIVGGSSWSVVAPSSSPDREAAPTTASSTRAGTIRRRQGCGIVRHLGVRARLQLLPLPRRQRRPDRLDVPRSQHERRPDPGSGANSSTSPASRFEQFVAYVQQTLRGNLGDSFLSNRPVTTEIREAIWPTVALVGTSTVLAMLIGVTFGIYAGWRRRSKFDVASTSFSMFTYSVPDFWLGMLLLAFFAVASAGSRPADSKTPAARQPDLPRCSTRRTTWSCQRSRSRSRTSAST